MRFSEILGTTFGPQMLNMVVKQDEIARYLVDKMNLPEKLVRTAEEQQEIVSRLQSQQQQANMQPNELGETTNQEVQ